uniref:Uncharacterized protein n=1 Tax=viral metagenome TaxID=1070528 RepID=A0A6M3X4H9_9ZZZZ
MKDVTEVISKVHSKYRDCPLIATTQGPVSCCLLYPCLFVPFDLICSIVLPFKICREIDSTYDKLIYGGSYFQE